MRSSKLPEICVPCPFVVDDEGVDRWFHGLAYVPHAADARLSALMTAGEDLIASVEALFGLRAPPPTRTSAKAPDETEPSS